MELTAPGTPGTYYYGACVDAVTDESDTTNNCSSSVPVTVPQPKYPDLEVGAPTVDDTQPAPGGDFTLSAAVSNTGDGEAAATTLRYYQSTDATIETSDTEVGTQAVAGLPALVASAESISLTAPEKAGTYYYGACVDAVAEESDTTNNCSTAVTVTVAEFQLQRESHPDLEVGTPTVDDANPSPGGTFTLSATVSNTGDGESEATTLRYYRSADATVTSSDTEVGTDAIAVLAAAGSSDQSVELTAPDSAGPYYYGACVDTVTDESDTTNNCSASVRVDVEEPKYPDLEVGTPTVNNSLPTLGETFTLSATVENVGRESSPATTLRYYRYKYGQESSQTEVGTDAIAGLAASASDSQSVDVSLSGPPREWWGIRLYRACVDAVPDEADTTNNCSPPVQVNGRPKPAATIGITPASVSLDEVGGTARLTARILDADGNETMPRSSWDWTSANEEVTEVRGHGKPEPPGPGEPEKPWVMTATVEAIGVGTTAVKLSVDSGSVTGTATVTLAGPRVEVSPRSLNFGALGATETVTVRVLDENGEEDEDATFTMFSLFSPLGGIGPPIGNGGLDITKVDGGIEVTANGNGSGRISISSGDAEKAVLPVSVWQTAATLEVAPDSVSLAVDRTATLTAKAKDSNGNELQVADRN